MTDELLGVLGDSSATSAVKSFLPQGHEPPREPAKLNRRGRQDSAEARRKM